MPTIKKIVVTGHADLAWHADYGPGGEYVPNFELRLGKERLAYLYFDEGRGKWALTGPILSTDQDVFGPGDWSFKHAHIKRVLEEATSAVLEDAVQQAAHNALR